MLDVDGFLYVFNKIYNRKIYGKIVYYWRCCDYAAKFFPYEKVKEAWGILKCEFKDDEIDLVTYFEENYVVGKSRMRFRKKEATRYKPCFQIDMWLVHSRTLKEMPRTSNSAEVGTIKYLVYYQHTLVYIHLSPKFKKNNIKLK